jgi:peptide/nickel transport system permease protein
MSAKKSSNPSIPEGSEASAPSGQASEQEQEQKQLSQSYWALVWWRFKRSKAAIVGAIIVVLSYFMGALFAEFFSPYLVNQQSEYVEARPQWPHFIDEEGNFHVRPFVYGLEETIDQELFKRTFEIDKTKQYPLYFFVRAAPYKLLGVIPMDIHLFGTDPDNSEAHAYIFGTDGLGRDVLSRIIYGARLSLVLGLAGQALTLIFGATLGAISGYYGGGVDMLIMRTTEFLNAFPREPILMALAAIIPDSWNPMWIYFGLTILLAFVYWGGLARQVRGLVLSIREREFVLAAQSFGASDRRLLFRHLIPNTMSHIIVIATTMVPAMIQSETFLGFLGLGLRPPLTSWGILMNEVSNVRAIRFHPWLLLPVPFILVSLLGFNLMGDGLRDAIDPYSR